ncbi:unnamed protein product [Rhizophagus irregularis]|nr:unnamed protein product [Rhizophagus irregularis]
MQVLTENGNINWSTLYDQYIDTINDVPQDLLRQPVDEEEVYDEESEDELPFEEDEDEDEEQYRYDWMQLAEMGPKAIIHCASDFGSRDMDRNHDWITDAQQNYSNNDIASVDEFIKNASNSGILDGREVDIDSIDYWKLNENQKKIFTRIESHYNDILNGKKVKALRIMIMGTAGTGKSYLIKTIRQKLHEMAGTDTDSPVLVIAPTGVAAFNINGSTIHSTLSIPIRNSKNLELDSRRLKQLQERLKKVIYLIIDEKSMVRHRILAVIDVRLRQAFPENSKEPFGGRSIILLGDFGQLPPVLDVPMFSKNTSVDGNSNKGIAAYKHIREVFKLDVILRQTGNSNEQKEFRDILLRMRDRESSLDDWKILSTRFEENLNQQERERFSDAVFLLTTWNDVDKINIEKLRFLKRPVAKIMAVHTGGNEAKKASSDVAKGLEPQLLLAKGARVMLTANLWTKGRLVNGSIGTVHDILFKNQGPPSLPAAVFVKFDAYEGPTITSTEGDHVVPIVPIKRSWKGKSGMICSRQQVPLCLAWAITMHKSQGLTLSKAKIDIGSKEFAAGLTFVAASRVRSLSDIYFR